jgi:hypothetical protein
MFDSSRMQTRSSDLHLVVAAVGLLSEPERDKELSTFLLSASSHRTDKRMSQKR